MGCSPKEAYISRAPQLRYQEFTKTCEGKRSPNLCSLLWCYDYTVHIQDFHKLGKQGTEGNHPSPFIKGQFFWAAEGTWVSDRIRFWLHMVTNYPSVTRHRASCLCPNNTIREHTGKRVTVSAQIIMLTEKCVWHELLSLCSMAPVFDTLYVTQGIW